MFYINAAENCAAACAGVVFLPKLGFEAKKWLVGICSCVNKI